MLTHNQIFCKIKALNCFACVLFEAYVASQQNELPPGTQITFVNNGSGQFVIPIKDFLNSGQKGQF